MIPNVSFVQFLNIYVTFDCKTWQCYCFLCEWGWIYGILQQNMIVSLQWNYLMIDFKQIHDCHLITMPWWAKTHTSLSLFHHVNCLFGATVCFGQDHSNDAEEIPKFHFQSELFLLVRNGELASQLAFTANKTLLVICPYELCLVLVFFSKLWANVSCGFQAFGRVSSCWIWQVNASRR